MAEVTDPSLIAMLEQPQTKINETLGAGIKPEDMTSVRNEALEKIALARSLKKRSDEGWTTTGFLAGTMSGLGNWTPAGAVAADTSTLKNAGALQRIMEMAKASGGKNPLTPLSNSDFQALAESVANLDPTQPDDQYQRNVSTVEDIYKRAFTGAGGGDLEAELKPYLEKYGVTAGAPKPAGPGDIGFNGAPPPPSNPLNPQQQTAYDAWHAANPKATPEQLVAFVSTLGAGDMSLEDARKIVEARDAGAGVQPGSSAVSGMTPEEQAEADRRVAEASGFDRISAGVADTVTMGTSNKIIAAGRDLAGKGEFDRELLIANAVTDQIAEESPWLYHGGQVGGGLALPMFGARTPAQLAKVAAAYGGAYGAGSSDTLAEVPGNAVTGAAIGGATGWAGGKLAQKLEQRAARKAAEVGTDSAEEGAETAADRYARAQQFGMDLSIGDVGGMNAKAIERTLDTRAGSATVMDEARNRLRGQIENALDDVANKAGPATSFRGMGEAAQRGSKAWIDKFERVSERAYAAIPIAPDTEAATGGTVTALRELTTIFESNPYLAHQFKNPKLENLLDGLAEDRGGLGLSWADLKSLRSRIGEEIGEQRFSDSPTKSELRRLYAALSEDMRVTALAQGPKAIAAFDRANRFYRQGQQRIENALKDILGDDSMKAPEAAASKLQSMVREGKSSADLAKIQAVWKSLPQAERGEVANGLIRLMGQPSNSEGRAFSAQTFIRNFNDMAPAAKNLIFGAADKELRQNLDEFAKVMGDVSASDATRNTSNTAVAVANAKNLVSLASQYVTSYNAARLWTNPRFVRWATGYQKMLRGAARAGKEPQMDGQLRLLDRLIATEPAIAQEATGLREAILRGANDNFSAAAASSGDQEE